MTRVVVMGGGTAGVSAALAARRRGASVVVLEASNRLPPDRSLLPYLLSGVCSKEDIDRTQERPELGDSHIDVRLGRLVDGVDHRAGRLRSGDLELQFDSLVVACGSESSTEMPRGFSKRDAFVLKGTEDYLSLAESATRLAHLALVGSAPLALVTASELSSKTKVSVFVGSGGLRRFAPAIRRTIMEAARTKSVAIKEADVEAVVGVRHVEAVISEASTLACDGAAILPSSRPARVNVDCARGRHGGIVVDDSMRTSVERVFGAGDCTEMRFGIASFPFRLHSSARVMGEVAGTNAAGGSERARVSGAIAVRIFGLEFCAAGLSRLDAESLGMDVQEVESDEAVPTDELRSGRCIVAITFQRGTGRVHGLQVAGDGALSHSEYISSLVANHATLRDIVAQESAYLPRFNRDVSPISLTAARALVGWFKE